LKLKKILLTILGFISLVLGAIGVIIPVMPTTPFVLLAAICFSTGSSRLSGWLSKSKAFGPYIDNYRTKRGISRLRKTASIIFVWVGLSISMVLVRTLWVSVLLGVVGIGVSIHLLMIKTRTK
jgi:uncharacterized membrane protein YbaN (DUF454 family)